MTDMRNRLSEAQAVPQALPGVASMVLDQPCRCACCRRVLTADRSLRRGFGPDCWARMHAAVIADRRRIVRAQLGALTGSVDRLDAHALLGVADALADVLDGIAGDLR